MKIIIFLIFVAIWVSPCCSICFDGGFRRNRFILIQYPDGQSVFISTNATGQAHFDSRCYNCSEIIIFRRHTTPNPIAFTLAPSTLDLAASPSSMTFNGSGISTDYGMPMIEFEDLNGNLMSSVNAVSVSADGTSLMTETPNFASVWSGQYRAVIYNRYYDGGWMEVGDADITITGRDPVDQDGDGWYSDVDCDDQDPNVNPGASPDCSGAVFDQNCNGTRDMEECFQDTCLSGGLCNIY